MDNSEEISRLADQIQQLVLALAVSDASARVTIGNIGRVLCYQALVAGDLGAEKSDHFWGSPGSLNSQVPPLPTQPYKLAAADQFQSALTLGAHSYMWLPAILSPGAPRPTPAPNPAKFCPHCGGELSP